jgi:hypothetical protein
MPRKSKTLLIAVPMIVVLVLLVAYEYGYRGLEEDLAAADEQQTVKRKTLDKYISAIVQKPHLEAALVALKEKRKEEDTRITEGSTPSICAAALQSSIKTMITAGGGTISSDRVEKPEDHGKFKIISVTVDAVFPDVRALCDTLYTIETQLPYLASREMDLRIMNYKEPRELSVKLKISAIARGK